MIDDLPTWVMFPLAVVAAAIVLFVSVKVSERNRRSKP